jgi:hypothetical protein
LATSPTFTVSGTNLSVNISNAITSETIYLSPVTPGGVTDPKPITIKVCGNETISLVETGDLKISEMPSDTLTIVNDVVNWFSTNDVQCPINKYTMKAYNGVGLFSHPEVVFFGTSLTISRNNVYQTIFNIQSETIGGVTTNRRVNVDIVITCGSETLTFA